MAQSGQIENVMYDTGAGRFFIADNDEVPGGSIVQATTNPLTGMVRKLLAGDKKIHAQLVDATTTRGELHVVDLSLPMMPLP